MRFSPMRPGCNPRSRKRLSLVVGHLTEGFNYDDDDEEEEYDGEKVADASDDDNDECGYYIAVVDDGYDNTISGILGEKDLVANLPIVIYRLSPEHPHVNGLSYGKTHHVKKSLQLFKKGMPCFAINTKLGTGRAKRWMCQIHLMKNRLGKKGVRTLNDVLLNSRSLQVNSANPDAT
ncbi:hypothetical protein DPMN_090046 [Dreissena polymorpha]|uniref:Uncharacterized protein n=1 Tax=Dreissena polymorpha TaxID=45954 RepID=A0A9D4KX08_DREPO|nr:hypothetical protein DPMN_090046 [Dreissena polymorpha]